MPEESITVEGEVLQDSGPKRTKDMVPMKRVLAPPPRAVTEALTSETAFRSIAGQRTIVKEDKILGPPKSVLNFNKALRDILIKEGMKEVPGKGLDKSQRPKIEHVVRAVYDLAIEGDMAAANFIFDRTEGKITPQKEDRGDINIVVINGARMEEI